MKLQPHPQSGPSAPIAIAAEVHRRAGGLEIRFSLSASGDAVRLPPAAEPGRADGLWQTTCFEAFIRGEGDAYAELNFSPSGQWAAYAFEGYRQEMRELELAAPPAIDIDQELGQLSLTVAVRLADEFMQAGSPLALSAVIEEMDGTTSYWALAHAEGPPDFHHPDCFAARLA